MNDATAFKSEPSSKTLLTVGFYNLEIFFDTIDDPNTLDDAFTPEGIRSWDQAKYDKKLAKLSQVIAKIGQRETGTAPALIGVSEVENVQVLNDLINTTALKDHHYGAIHYDSPDERGIDVALIYKKADFTLLNSKPLTLHLDTDKGGRDYTRDVLHVHGVLAGIEVHVFVNHWPSRRSGQEETSAKRIEAAQRNREEINKLLEAIPNVRIIIMGDFNDEPQSASVENHLVQNDFYNPMVYLATKYQRSLNYKNEWFTFDQVIFSNNFVKMYQNDLVYKKSDIFNDHFLTEYEGKYKGNPFRTFVGKKYVGGYSDHFPVYSILSS